MRGDRPAECPHVRRQLLDAGHRTDAQWAALQRWLEVLHEARARLAVIELGAGSAVPTVRRFCEDLARSPETTLIRINPCDPAVAITPAREVSS